MPRIGATRTVGGKLEMYTKNGWVPYSGGQRPTTMPETPPGPAPGPAPGTVLPPNQDDYWFVRDPNSPTGVTPAEPGTPGAFLDNIGYMEDAMTYQNWLAGDGGAAGPSAAELAIQQEAIHAQNLGTYLDATVSQIEAEIAAGRLKLDQAQAEFDRRMDAFAEGGKQMGEMWQWTSAPGTETLLTDVRANLGMEPWKSQPVEFDPFAMAWDIVEQTPEILQESPSFDPLTEALDLVKQFV